ncbi:hypothetical protein [Streptomyces sp. NPDC004726]
MTLHSGWLAPTGQTRQATRHTAFGGTTPAGPIQSRSGILPGADDGTRRLAGLSLSGLSPMTANVSAGRAVVQGPALQGAYPAALDQGTAISFTDGDSANPRIDLVVLRVYDSEFDGSQRTEAAIEIVPGTPSPTPVRPAVPALALALYAVRIPAGTSAGTGGVDWATAVTDLRTAVVAVGGILPVHGGTAVAGAYPGQYQDTDGSSQLQRWNGTAWIPYPKETGGIAPAGAISTASYTGQYRDTPGGHLQRWNGTAWVNYQPPVEVETTTTGATALTEWALVSFDARRTRGICTLTLLFARTGPNIPVPSHGNITDEQVCTLPAGWRPAFDVEAPACDGYGSGGATIAPSGLVRLRTWTGNGELRTDRQVRMTATFVQ